MDRPEQQQMMNSPLVANGAQGSRERHGFMSGFEIWSPSAPQEQSNFVIAGSEFSQVLEIQVRRGELVTAEPGSMLYMSPGVTLAADMGGFGQGCKRCCCAGESMFRLHLENSNGNDVEKLALTPQFPAKIVPVDLRQHSGMIFNRGAFLAALGKNWRVDIRTVTSAATCCFGGQGLFMNTLHGDGMVFLNAGGTVMTKVLQAGEEIIIDKHGLLAFESTVQIGIRRTGGGCMVCCCAGQGLFNTVLTGPGFVMVHTMALSKLRRAVGVQAGGGAANSNGSS